jgi:hypothetical protein
MWLHDIVEDGSYLETAITSEKGLDLLRNSKRISRKLPLIPDPPNGRIYLFRTRREPASMGRPATRTATISNHPPPTITPPAPKRRRLPSLVPSVTREDHQAALTHIRQNPHLFGHNIDPSRVVPLGGVPIEDPMPSPPNSFWPSDDEDLGWIDPGTL